MYVIYGLLKAPVNIVPGIKFYLGAVPVGKKRRNSCLKGLDPLYFQCPPHVYCMRGPSLVELTGRDDSADDIMVHID